ncbi:MAG: hypothetical protein NTY08_10855 [Proteobacteria bacterium]|nr:hypothetical protein [Pseudomonadota bacterium]
MRHARREHFWIAPWALSVLALAACSRAEFSADPAPSQRVKPATSAQSKVERTSADLQALPKSLQVPNDQQIETTPVVDVTDAKNSQGDDRLPDQPKPVITAPPEKDAPPEIANGDPNPAAENGTPSISSVPTTDEVPPLITPPIITTTPPPSAHQDDVPPVVADPPRDTPPVASTPVPPETPPVVNTPPTKDDTPIVSAPPPDIAPLPPHPTPAEPGPSVVLKPCSQTYMVPATANPYFASNAANSSLTYRISSYDPPTPTDVTPKNSPILVAPIGDCITAGKQIYFSVSGSITFSRVDAPTDGNGSLSQIVHHQKGATLGKSDIIAPINSLIGVFLSESDPAGMPAPATLDFSTQKARDYVSLSPAVGQVFFIGTGLTSTGEHHKVVVPQGATRLYFAVMDIYQWNNNSGSLSGAIMTE